MKAERDHDAASHSGPRSGQPDFALDETWVDRLVVLSLSGSVDMLVVPQLTEAIDSAFAKSPTGMVIDLANVDFLASAGISVLVAAHASAGQSGLSDRFGVVADGAVTHRPLTLLGLDEVIPLYCTMDDALSKLAQH